MQTALVEALVRWRRISRVDHPDAYVRRIVTTRHLDWHRRRSSREESLDQAVDDGRVDVADAGAAPDHAAGVVDRQQILEALATHTKPQRAVVALRYYEGYDDAAIAAVLGARRAGYTASRRSSPLNRRSPGAAAWRSRTLLGQAAGTGRQRCGAPCAARCSLEGCGALVRLWLARRAEHPVLHHPAVLFIPPSSRRRRDATERGASSVLRPSASSVGPVPS